MRHYEIGSRLRLLGLASGGVAVLVVAAALGSDRASGTAQVELRAAVGESDFVLVRCLD